MPSWWGCDACMRSTTGLLKSPVFRTPVPPTLPRTFTFTGVPLLLYLFEYPGPYPDTYDIYIYISTYIRILLVRFLRVGAEGSCYCGWFYSTRGLLLSISCTIHVQYVQDN